MPLLSILGGFETFQKHFFEIFGVKEQKEKTRKNENSGEMSENVEKNWKIEISVEIFYRSPPKTEISQMFRPKFPTFCSLVPTMESMSYRRSPTILPRMDNFTQFSNLLTLAISVAT